MNIAIVTPSYLPSRGGSEQTVYEWTKRLVVSHGVSIVTLNHSGSPRRETSPEGVEIYRIPPLFIRRAGHYLRALHILATLLSVDRKKRIDVVHLGHTYDMGHGTLAFKFLMRRPLVTTLLGWDTCDPFNPVPPKHRPYVAFVMNSSDRVVAVSGHVADWARRQGCRKEIENIPHGTAMHNRRGTISVRSKHGIGESAKICFSLQRLDRRKGLEYLIKAVPEVLREERDVTFVVGGSGPLEQSLREMCIAAGVRDRVIFAGFIPDDELASYYEQADLFVLPTLYEAFGLVYADALAKGLPIVTTSVGGALDIVSPDVGMLVPPRDAPALAAAVVRALKRTWNTKTIVSRARQYDWDRIVARYVEIYQSVSHG